MFFTFDLFSYHYIYQPFLKVLGSIVSILEDLRMQRFSIYQHLLSKKICIHLS